MIQQAFHILILMPPPPGAGTNGGNGDWWRIAGVLAITVSTVAAFAWLFRPIADGSHLPNLGGERLTPATESGNRGMQPAANVIPMRESQTDPGVSEIEFAAAAASERLRRLTNRPTPITSGPSSERRRLGSRRSTLPDQESAPKLATVAPITPTVVQPPIDLGKVQKGGATMQSESTDLPANPITWDVPPASEIAAAVDDLLGEIANRRPSDYDATTDSPFSTMKGEVPTAAEVDSISDDVLLPGNIVQFVPRTTREDPAPLDDDYRILEEANRDASIINMPVDAATRQTITATVQELLFCANVGEFMHGFALYTDRYLFQFMTESGFNEQSFRDTFSALPGKEPPDWTRIQRIDNVQRREDGRITADITYLEQGNPTSPERFTFKRDVITERWLIDGIEAI